MASSAGIGEEAEAAGNAAAKSRRRISDYLGDSDGDAEAEKSAPSPPATPPQLRLPRFTCARFRFARFSRKRDDSRKEAGAKKAEGASVPDSSGAGALAVSLFRTIFICVSVCSRSTSFEIDDH